MDARAVRFLHPRGSLPAAICGLCHPLSCRCSCGCTAHSHYRRCDSCASGRHAGHRRAVSIRAAYAFGLWRDPDHTRHLGHLLPGLDREH